MTSLQVAKVSAIRWIAEEYKAGNITLEQVESRTISVLNY